MHDARPDIVKHFGNGKQGLDMEEVVDYVAKQVCVAVCLVLD